MLRQETQPSTGQVVNGGHRECNEEVQHNTQNIGSCASMKSLLSQQAPGNYEWNVPSKQDAGLCQVQRPGDRATDRDCQESVPFPPKRRRRILLHSIPHLSVICVQKVHLDNTQIALEKS